jgi:DNA replication and repair protein RecF
MLSTSKSFRNAKDQKIVQWKKDGYGVRGKFSSDHREYEIGLEYSGDKKILSINGNQEKQISNIVGLVYCVLYYLEDIYLITGPPVLRRNFLNLVLATADPIYFKNLKLYLNVIRHKSRYLKDNVNIDKNLLSTWNDQIIAYGSYLIHKRYQFIDFINSFIEISLDTVQNLVFPFRLCYRSNIMNFENSPDLNEIKVWFEKKLNQDAKTEIKMESAIYGPHRDDFIFTDNTFEVRYFGSVGEARLSSIILKLAQADYYVKTKNEVPIHLIDDILLELDMKNMEKVLNLLNRGDQKIITTTERAKLPEIFSCDRVFHVTKKGSVSW